MLFGFHCNMDIYNFYEDLVLRLQKYENIVTISEEFSKILRNSDRVNFVEKLLLKFGQIEKINGEILLHKKKDNAKSSEFRVQGNHFFSFKYKNNFKALELYNQSICFAEKGSENISIGYANRSAILFEWKLYKECIENIKLSRSANYPERLMHKLNKREEECLKLLSTRLESNIIPSNFELSYEPHHKVPYIANCLDMKNTDEEGRLIYTKTFLNAGDLISVEEPFCSILLPTMKYTRCAHCKCENNLILIPCPNCTSAMFCSESCLLEATNTFHKFECPIIDLLFSLFNKIHLIALRVSLTALNIFDNCKHFMEYFEVADNKNQNAFSLDYKHFNRKEHYKAIHGLVTNEEKRSTSDLFQRAAIVAVLKYYLLTNTPLKELLLVEEEKEFFAEVLFRHMMTAPSNMHTVSLIEHKNSDDAFASAAYSFGSLINHSCSPNVVRIYKGTSCYLFVLRPIPANGELFDNYGYHFVTHPKQDRQKNLSTQYLFNCKCEGCVNNYPLYANLPCPTNVPVTITDKDVNALMSLDFTYAKDNYQHYSEFLNIHKNHFPCFQISAVEESFKIALNILFDAVPLRAKY